MLTLSEMIANNGCSNGKDWYSTANGLSFEQKIEKALEDGEEQYVNWALSIRMRHTDGVYKGLSAREENSLMIASNLNRVLPAYDWNVDDANDVAIDYSDDFTEWLSYDELLTMFREVSRLCKISLE